MAEFYRRVGTTFAFRLHWLLDEHSERNTLVEPSQTTQPWHALPLDKLFAALDVGDDGLSEAEARTRLERWGPNQLPHQPPPAWWRILLRQFRNPLIYILGLAAIVSTAMGHVTDAAFIAAVLGLNAAIGGFQEWRAEKSALALQQLLKIRASVERDGEISEIDAEAVVPGDVVWLESGNRVPADVRLLSAHSLEVDESLLTGESLAVQKDPTRTDRPTTPLADRLNMAHAGSVIARGRAKGLVVATGVSTAVGQLALDVLRASGGKPPLLVRMEKFTHVVAVAVLVAAVVVGVLGVVLQGYGWAEMFMFAVALAVSAIPEGLPIALTVALAIATTRMARRGVIVRKLAAVEGLGSCTLIATDKTGTLTCNELTVRDVRLANGEQFEVTGEGFVPTGDVLRGGESVSPHSHDALDRLARAGVLCNEADLHHRAGGWAWRGDAVDVAFLSFGHKLGQHREAGLDENEQVNQLPFEPERQFAASYHVRANRRVHRHRNQAVDVGAEDPTNAFATSVVTNVYVKGAPERILSMCNLSPAEVRDQIAVAEEMARQGYRVLALAEGDIGGRISGSDVPPTPSGLTLLGFAGMIDPLRPGVRDAVTACRAAGVRVCMVTGDHRVTAQAIARELGIVDDAVARTLLSDSPDGQECPTSEQVVTGGELLDKTPEEIRELVQRTAVFARVAPQQKLQLVEAAREAGQFVAVTGDGVNDAPALRHANIGVAMGKSGTDVAREAAELVISDDNFATIVAGVEEGRIAYDNVRKVIYLLISTGAAEIVLVTLAVITGTPLPLLPVQLLWLNLVTNGIQDVALAFEPGEEDVLRRQPRPPRERIFNRLMIERTLVGALVIGLVGFGAFYWMLHSGMSEAAARNALLLLMVLFENVHIGNCRSETQSAFRLSPLRSPILLGGTLLAFTLHAVMLYLPLGQNVLQTAPVGITMWLALIGLALTVFVAMEIHKRTWAWRTRASTHR